jgi:hypothetical protein
MRQRISFADYRRLKLRSTMSDISTEAATDIPDFPTTRAAICPFAPAPELLALNTTKQLSKVRIWDGSTPWLIYGYGAIRTLYTDLRTSVDDRLPGYPHWNIVLPTLLRRVPTLRLAVPVEELPFKHDMLTYGVYELPATC